MMETSQKPVEYTIPAGCPCCGADLPVRVSERGPFGVCRVCHIQLRPTLRMTNRGLEVDFTAAAA